MVNVRVRFAPSPTGHLHIGSARTALFNWLFARATGGSFILRIEDTDALRSKKEYLDSILRDLKWLGLSWDEGPGGPSGPGGPDIGRDFGPYFQMERLHTYKKYADELLSCGKAYYCFCSKEELELQREEKAKLKQDTGYAGKCRALSKEEIDKFIKEGRKPVIRFKVSEGVTSFKDIVRGVVEFNNNTIEDFVIIKSDGIPVYNFAAVIDDYLMKITHIIRGDEHISNTPRQIMIAGALGFSLPEFAHIPIVLNPDKTKLSKRAGASNLQDFENMGYIPQGLINFLCLLGWSYGDDADIMRTEEIIRKFSLERIINHPAVFDDKKLDAVNASHIRMLADAELIKMLKEFGKDKLNIEVDEAILTRAAVLYKERIKTLKDFFNKTGFLFGGIKEYDPKGIEKYFKADFLKEGFERIIKEFSVLENFNAENTEKVIRTIAETLNISAGKLIHSLRLAVSGKTETAGLFEILEILGKDKVVERIKKIISAG